MDFYDINDFLNFLIKLFLKQRTKKIKVLLDE